MISIEKPMKVVILGYNGSGKTFLCKNIIKNYGLPTLIYDWHNEYKDLERKDNFYYVPKFRFEIEKRIVEFDKVINEVFIKKKNKIKLLVVDELDEYAPNKAKLPNSLQDLYANHRHYGQSFIGLARRPTDINTKLIELAHYRIFFRLFGKNDLQYIESLKSGLAETVSHLGKYQYVVLDSEGNSKVYSGT